MYEVLKTFHVLGVVLLLGNVTVSAVWKVFADRTGDPRVARFAQQLITLTDWSITLLGIALIFGGGYGMAALRGMPLAGETWLVAGQVLFAISGVIWVSLLVPAQVRLARQARQLNDQEPLPALFRRESQRWLVWGVIATIPLVAALYLMIAKPV